MQSISGENAAFRPPVHGVVYVASTDHSGYNMLTINVM